MVLPENQKKLYISLSRDIVNHFIFTDDAEFFRAWVAILLRVNHSVGKKIKGNEVVTIDIGETITSEKQLMELCKLSRKRLKRFLKILESDGMISLEKSRKGTRLKVHGYRFYQNKGTTEEQQRDKEGTTEEQQKNNRGTTEEQKGASNNKKNNKYNELIMNNKTTSDKSERLLRLDSDIDLILKTYIVGKGGIYRGSHLNTKEDIKKLLTHKDYGLTVDELINSIECYLIKKNISKKENKFKDKIKYHEPRNFFISNRKISVIGENIGEDKEELLKKLREVDSNSNFLDEIISDNEVKDYKNEMIDKSFDLEM